MVRVSGQHLVQLLERRPRDVFWIVHPRPRHGAPQVDDGRLGEADLVHGHARHVVRVVDRAARPAAQICGAAVGVVLQVQLLESGLGHVVRVVHWRAHRALDVEVIPTAVLLARLAQRAARHRVRIVDVQPDRALQIALLARVVDDVRAGRAIGLHAVQQRRGDALDERCDVAAVGGHRGQVPRVCVHLDAGFALVVRGAASHVRRGDGALVKARQHLRAGRRHARVALRGRHLEDGRLRVAGVGAGGGGALLLRSEVRLGRHPGFEDCSCGGLVVGHVPLDERLGPVPGDLSGQGLALGHALAGQHAAGVRLLGFGRDARLVCGLGHDELALLEVAVRRLAGVALVEAGPDLHAFDRELVPTSHGNLHVVLPRLRCDGGAVDVAHILLVPEQAHLLALVARRPTRHGGGACERLEDVHIFKRRQRLVIGIHLFSKRDHVVVRELLYGYVHSRESASNAGGGGRRLLITRRRRRPVQFGQRRGARGARGPRIIVHAFYVAVHDGLPVTLPGVHGARAVGLLDADYPRVI